MAKSGLSKAYYAIYDANNGNPTYKNGGVFGKAVDAEIAVDSADPSIFYADNGPAESAQRFSGGTLTLTNDRYSLEAVSAVLGLTVETVTTPAAGSVIDFPAEMNVPYVGYGTIFRDQVDNVPIYRPVVLLKVQFQVPNDSGTTEGETIEFSGHEFAATIMRSDEAKHRWKTVGQFASEADAEAWIKSVLNITASNG